MNDSSRWLACALVLALANQSCCTAAGFGIGAIVDASSERKYEARFPSEAGSIESGEPVVLRTSNGESVRGDWLGVARRRPNDVESHIVVETESGLDVLDASELNRIEVAKPKRARLIGAGVGLGVDVVAVTTFVLIAAFCCKSMGSGMGSTGSSGGW
jgi:hypothetical protein